MHIQFQNTAADYVESSRQNMRIHNRQRRLSITLGLLMVLLFALDAGYTHSTSCWPLAAYGLVIAIVNSAFSLDRWAQNWFTKHQHSEESFAAEIDEHGIKIKSPTASHDFLWKHFDRVQETENNFSLFNGLVFYMFPKRAFAPDDANEFRLLAQGNISAKPSASGTATA